MNANGSGAPGPEAGSVEPAPAVQCRPWLAPAIACGVAAAVLLVLSIPGVLRYPEPVSLPTPPAPNPDAIVAQRESNRALEERIASLRRVLDGGVCVAPEGVRLLQQPGAPELTPQDRAALPSPPLSATPAPQTAVPQGAAFSGSLLDLIDQATTLVLVANAAGELVGSGSGFLVAPGAVMTNRHVVGEAAGGKFLVVGRGVGVQKADLVASSADGTPGAPDFAVLRLQNPARAAQAVPLTFAPGADRLEGVIAAGYPALVLKSDQKFQALVDGRSTDLPTAAVTEGVVTALQTGEGTSIVLHTAQITPGNSGGPLVDRCGRIVGINTFILTEQDGRMNYALSSADVRRFLTANNIEPRVSADRCQPPTAALAAPSPTSPNAAPPNAAPQAPGAVPGAAPNPGAPPSSAPPGNPAAVAPPGKQR